MKLPQRKKVETKSITLLLIISKGVPTNLQLRRSQLLDYLHALRIDVSRQHVSKMIKSVKRQIFKEMRTLMRPKWERMEKAMARAEYTDQHIGNTKLLPGRGDLLKSLPRGGVVAELGVNKGEFSELILETCQPEKLHLVDMWGSTRFHDGLRQLVEEKFKSEIEQDKVEIHVGMSTAVANGFPDAYFDWVYIDTDHSYRTTLSELELYAPKIKPGGLLCGHDYIVGNWKGMVRYGVKEAVTHFCVTHGYELVYLTMETWFNPSFAIRKIT